MIKKSTYEELEQRIQELEQAESNNKFSEKQLIYSHDSIGGIITYNQILTDRKKNEEALRESKEKYSSLVESTTDWIWEVDTESVYTYSNSKIKDILGYELEEVIGTIMT